MAADILHVCNLLGSSQQLGSQVSCAHFRDVFIEAQFFRTCPGIHT